MNRDTIFILCMLLYRLDKEKGGAQKRRGPMMLILAPTRELAQQSQDVLGKPTISFKISPLEGNHLKVS